MEQLEDAARREGERLRAQEENEKAREGEEVVVEAQAAQE